MIPKVDPVPVVSAGFAGQVRILEWKDGDTFPEMGPVVGIDTETELITDCNLFPPVVVLGCFDPTTRICWQVHYPSIAQFMRELCARPIRQRYFNIGFDEGVLANEDPLERPLMRAIDEGKVRCMQIRSQLYDIATVGFVRYKYTSLAEASKYYNKLWLDKGDGTEDSARLSFRRGVPLTAEQSTYLMYDCLATWELGEHMPEQGEPPMCQGMPPLEEVHTKGACMLANISNNGFPVDMAMHGHFTKLLNEARDDAREKLVQFGFPDPYRDADAEVAEELGMLRQCGDMLGVPEAEWPDKNGLRWILATLRNYDGHDAEACRLCLSYVLAEAKAGRSTKSRKKIMTIYEDLTNEHEEIQYFEAASRVIVYRAFVARTMLSYLKNSYERHVPLGTLHNALREAADFIENERGHWLVAKGDEIGPRQFFIGHVKKVMAENPELIVDYTKGGDPKMTKNDLWRLEDLGIEDKFLEAHTEFQHATKYLSTYLKPEDIRPDGKVRCRYNNIVNTGRTSARGPNMQNYPSFDEQFPLKLMFRAPPGYVLCATDFGFAELVAFAQSCYTRFGHSVMGDVINAGIDPHRFFGGVMNGAHDGSTAMLGDKEWAKSLNDMLKERVDKATRQAAKCPNFGLPGAMGAARYYVHMRVNGLDTTPQEAADQRQLWINTFTEMKKHMRPEEIKNTRFVEQQYGYEEEEEEIETSTVQGNYIARTIHGMVRNNCTFNSACNAQFQSLVAYGAKNAGWLLCRAGLWDRIVNFVHDEIIYILKPEEVDIWVPRIEALMIEGIKIAVPDVEIGVETSVGIHWDKGATEYLKLPRDEEGNIIVHENPYVRKVYEDNGMLARFWNGKSWESHAPLTPEELAVLGGN